MSSAEKRCPFLVPVTADRLWMYPVSAYCRRPESRIRVPAGSTLEQICSTPTHRGCPGFLATLEQDARASGR
jgi:hypothetical protein